MSTIDQNGYVRNMDHNDPNAYASGYSLEHRSVVSPDKKLPTNIHVHHLDEDTLNNARSNLLMVTRQQHKKLHHLMNRFPNVTKCIVCKKATLHPNCPICSIKCLDKAVVAPDLDELGFYLVKHDYNLPKVAEHYKVTRYVISQWINRLGLMDRPKQAPSKRPDLDELGRIYILYNFNSVKIAKHYGVSKQTVMNWNKALGIYDQETEGIRNRHAGIEKPPYEELKSAWEECGSYNSIAPKYDVSKETVRKWLWEYNIIPKPPAADIRAAIKEYGPTKAANYVFRIPKRMLTEWCIDIELGTIT